MNPGKTAGRRLFGRLLTLAVVAVLTYFLQKGFDEGGRFWMLALEMLILAIIVFNVLSQQTGRLKSGPDKKMVTFKQLIDEDPAVGTCIGVYMLLLMMLIVGKVIVFGPIEDASLGPWAIYIAMAPILAIVFWRQYKLDADDQSG